MRLLVDADGCPVVEIAIRVAKLHQLACKLICDTSHCFNKEGAETMIVSKGADSADYAIVNMLQADDIVVTQDYGLAAMVLARRGHPITQNGLVIEDANVNALLEGRHVARKIRSSGGRLKGPSKRVPEQDVAFESKLTALILLIAMGHSPQNR